MADMTDGNKTISRSQPDFLKGMKGTSSGMATTTQYMKSGPMASKPNTDAGRFNPQKAPASMYGLGGK